MIFIIAIWYAMESYAKILMGLKVQFDNKLGIF